MKELRKRASERHRKKEGADRKKGRKRARGRTGGEEWKKKRDALSEKKTF